MADITPAYIQTASGGRFFLFEPHLSIIKLEDIAHALSNTCRFTGHVREFYSVAQHSVLVSIHVGKDMYTQAEALLHDASEAFLCDIATPLKRSGRMNEYLTIERKVQQEIIRQLVYPGAEIHPPEYQPGIKEADLRALATEVRDLMPNPADFQELHNPFSEEIIPLGPKAAKKLFLARAAKLGLA